jgi:hypothetical protein
MQSDLPFATRYLLRPSVNSHLSGAMDKANRREGSANTSASAAKNVGMDPIVWTVRK